MYIISYFTAVSVLCIFIVWHFITVVLTQVHNGNSLLTSCLLVLLEKARTTKIQCPWTPVTHACVCCCFCQRIRTYIVLTVGPWKLRLPHIPHPGNPNTHLATNLTQKIPPKSGILTIMFIKLSTMFHLCVELAYRVVPFNVRIKSICPLL